MSTVKNSYEAVLVFSLKQGQENVESNVKKFIDLIESNATLHGVDEWGKRKLAYEVNKEKEAYYVLFDFESDSSFPAELERICRINDGIIRSLVMKKENEKTGKAK